MQRRSKRGRRNERSKRVKDNAENEAVRLSIGYTASYGDNQVKVGTSKRPEEDEPTGPRREEARRWPFVEEEGRSSV